MLAIYACKNPCPIAVQLNPSPLQPFKGSSLNPSMLSYF